MATRLNKGRGGSRPAKETRSNDLLLSLNKANADIMNKFLHDGLGHMPVAVLPSPLPQDVGRCLEDVCNFRKKLEGGGGIGNGVPTAGPPFVGGSWGRATDCDGVTRGRGGNLGTCPGSQTG